MPGNSFGQLFRITTFGESHGPALGVVIDGCPAGLTIDPDVIQRELARRRPGQNRLTTPRDEKDQVEILSGVFEGKSTGAPIALMVRNKTHRPKDYDHLKGLYRPGHADATYQAKYGHRDHRGSGRASARETLSRVAAAAIAKQLLMQYGIQVTGYVTQIETVSVPTEQLMELRKGPHESHRKTIESNLLRCPDPSCVDAMTQAIESARADGDSVGGIVEVVATGLPAGLGEPVFHKLTADLAQALMSLPAVKGFEVGDGFASASKRGSENNDIFTPAQNTLGYTTESNHAGGILGGLSTGEPLILRCALKPPSSIAKGQNTVTKNGEATTLEVQGRHDPCVCPRAVPIAEAMVALVLADHLLLHRNSRI